MEGSSKLLNGCGRLFGVLNIDNVLIALLVLSVVGAGWEFVVDGGSSTDDTTSNIMYATVALRK
jgi:hypothetical protein